MKSQDYDLFHELVGQQEHTASVVNLHRVLLSLFLSMEGDFAKLTSDVPLLTKIDRLLTKVKKAVGEEPGLVNLKVDDELMKSFMFESLNEA